MAKRLLKRYGLWVLGCIIVAFLSTGFLLLPDALGGKIVSPIDEPAFDTELYKSMLSKLVADETELIDQFNADYLMLHPLMPPAPDWQLVMEGGVIPYDKASFPASWFLDELTRTSDMGVSCYSIILWLDPVTWQTVVIDEITMKEVTALSVPAGFNMLDFITAAWGEGILYGVDKEWVLSAYSPSRMAFRYRLFEKDDVDELVAEYSAAIAVTELASAPLKFAPMMLKSSSSSMEISGIEKTGSGMEITIELPDGWSSTNNIDVFKTGNLVSYWWSLLGTTNGSNTVTYTDTGSGSSDVELRFYRAGDGDTDTDDDGIVDARELLMYHSDPDDDDSYPVSVSGSITHTNTPQSGTIHVVAVTSSNTWDLGRFDDLSSPGAFEITGIPNLDDYWIKAWRDWCDNDQVDLWEATGTATNCPIYLTNSVSNIVITLTDPAASISGTLSYTGKQEGAWIAIVSTGETSWTESASCTAALSGFYHLSDLSQTSYYVKAWIDADGDSTCDPNSEAQGFWTSNPINLSNSVWDIDFELTDVNGDGDTMPDWWEILHFGNTNQTDSGDYDGDQMPNAWEYEWDFCPTNAADAMDDADADGYPNVYEYKHESDPWNISDDPDGGGDPEAPTPSVIVVTNGSIQAGLDAATNAYDIVRLDPGTYTGSTNRNLTFPSYPVLLIAKEAATNTVINCQSSGRAIFFSGQSNHTAVVQLTITGGSTNDFGGAIYFSSNSMPAIRSCIFTNNYTGEDGGALCISNASPLVDGCTFMSNIAADDGGAIRCDGDETATVITNCLFSDNVAGGKGGAFYCTDDADDVLITECTFTANTAGSNGGGLAISDANLTIRGCLVYGNAATNDGGDILLEEKSDALVEYCTIQNNEARADGGGIRCKDNSDATITACDILDNLARDNGGGLFCNDSADPVISNCVFNANVAWDHGGGLYIKDSQAWVGHSLIVSNTATDGGGIGYHSAVCTITTCAIGDNIARLDGGGIRAKDSTLTGRNLLVVGNRAFGQGGGIHFKGGTGTVENVTIADNISKLASGGIAITESGSVTGANVVIWGNTPDECETNAVLTYSCVTDWAGATMVTNAPLLASGTYHLLTNSPCIDAGTNLTWTTNAVDVDGEARVVNTNIDIGCDEWQYGAGGGSTTGGVPMFASSTGSSSSGLWSSTGAGGTAGPDELKLGVTIYDDSGSHSERYAISFSNSTDFVETECVGFGIPWSEILTFQKGTNYTIRIEPKETGTNSPCGSGVPDYDHTAWIEGVPATTNGAHADWVYGAGFAIHDPDGILGTRDGEGCTSTFYAGGKTATLYIIKVDSVEWETYTDGTPGTNRALDTNPNPGGGKRIFPDKISESDGNVAKRRKVHAVATVSPPVAGVTVHFKAFDVDDPSSSGFIDGTGGDGQDNEDGLYERNLTPVTTSATTDAAGKAKAVFTVTRYPGDNFKVVAGCSVTTVSGVDQPDVDTGPLPSGVVITDTLTVWRLLRIERDSMGSPDAVDTGVSTALTATTLTDSTKSWMSDYFVGSELYPSSSSSPGFSKEIAGNGATVLTASSPDLTVSASVGDDYTIQFDGLTASPATMYDEDGEEVPEPDIGALPVALAPCYIAVEELSGVTDGNAWWRQNFDGYADEYLFELGLRDTVSDQEFWVCQLIGEYEEDDSADNDPDGEGATLGIDADSFGLQGPGAIIYNEGIRDVCSELSASEADVRRITTNHEIGHHLGLNHSTGSTPDSAMWVPTTPAQRLLLGSCVSTFTESQVRDVRSLTANDYESWP